MEPREPLADLVAARLDGPHDDTSVVDAAAAVAEAVRLLSRATRTQPTAAPVVWAVVAELSTAMGRLDQPLEQLAERLTAVAAMPSVFDDRGQDPRATAAAAVKALQHARQDVGGLAAALDLAHQHLGHLGGGAEA